MQPSFVVYRSTADIGKPQIVSTHRARSAAEKAAERANRREGARDWRVVDVTPEGTHEFVRVDGLGAILRLRSLTPTYTRAAVLRVHPGDTVPTPVPGPVNPPEFVAGSACIIEGVDWNVSLFSDDTVRIRTSGVDLATGRFVTSTHRTDYGYSVSADIVDVSPVDAVSAETLRDLSSNLTFFAMRAGRFSGKVA